MDAIEKALKVLGDNRVSIDKFELTIYEINESIDKLKEQAAKNLQRRKSVISPVAGESSDEEMKELKERFEEYDRQIKEIWKEMGQQGGP